MSRKMSAAMSSQQKSPEAKRQYGCPCGKAYLSYPALFTHVKHKHDGKPPGNLIKPQTGKVRGRPKTRMNSEDLEMNQISEAVHRQIVSLLQSEKTDYDGEFSCSKGNKTCQDAASKFLSEFSESEQDGQKILACFLNELKATVNENLGEGYWEIERPCEIIEVANKLYAKHSEEQQILYPISKKLLKQLTFNFFEWLFAHKYTDHRLLKRIDSETITEL